MKTRGEGLGRRHAQALIEVLVEQGQEKGLVNTAKTLKKVGALVAREVEEFFRSPIFSQEEKRVLLKKLGKEQSIDPRLQRFLEAVLALGHFHLLPEIAEAFAEELRERRNEAVVQVRTARPLKEKERKRLAEAFAHATGKTISMEEKTDQTLIGGVVVEMGGVVYDSSIEGYLKRLREEFAV